MKAAIVGLSGPHLLDAEHAALERDPPAGVILFARNVVDRAQLAALIVSLRSVLPDGAVIMVDQEGGRVARLRPPHWRAHPPAGLIGALHARNVQAGLRAAWLTGALIGCDCRDAGFDVACAPVLDRRMPGAHEVVGDRAFAEDPHAITALAGQFTAGLLAAGVQPVGKHAPGHGHADCDSHLSLPRVAKQPEEDLLPFMRLASDLPWMMTAHILYEEWDRDRPGTLSPGVIGTVIRQRIGFEGMLVSDDLAMKALNGPPDELARAALAAGCDVALYCAGDAATASVLRNTPALRPESAARLAAARAMALAARRDWDAETLAAEREQLLA